MALALLLPGYQYSADRPLLHYAGGVFEKHGWAARAVRWPTLLPHRHDDLAGWNRELAAYVHLHVGRVLDGETDPRIALIGKSMGAYAASLAADRSLPAVWLTPVLRDTGLPADLRRATAPFLLLGSTGDPSWDPELARDLGRPFHEAEVADHSLEIAGDPVRSVDILREMTVAMDEFVSGL
ncbi:alpha/beta hydrolase [Actinoplanes sp. HUAS TT8]|uniref:alpha/beta hydrolase n=1 Tax=Actinoplanes sp. HUAS TT8 TaxID=3447453 RepID=UPI003F5215A9